MARVRAAIGRRFAVAYENRPVGNATLRNGLVDVRGEDAIIIDVACPFENASDVLVVARREESNFDDVRPYLSRSYQRVSVEVVVVGALGTWDAANDRVMRRFTLNAYLRPLKRLCVSDVVAALRQIYAMHVRRGDGRYLGGPTIIPIGWTSSIAVDLSVTRRGEPTTTSLARRSGGRYRGVVRKFYSVDGCGSSRRPHHSA